MVSIQSKSLFRILISLVFLALGALSLAPSPAMALGFGPGYAYPTMGYAAMGPMQGMPYFPNGQPNCAVLGQMQMIGPCGVNDIALYQYLNNNGTQRLGINSSIPPIGMASITNTLNYNQVESMLGGPGDGRPSGTSAY